MSTDEKNVYIGFKSLEKKIAKNKKVKNPGAVASAVGRKKYGAKKMGQLAHHAT